MIIKIYVPDKEYGDDYPDEIYTMFKLLCDNLNTDGLKCEKINKKVLL